MARREWDEIDAEAAREGEAVDRHARESHVASPKGRRHGEVGRNSRKALDAAEKRILDRHRGTDS